MKIAADKIHPVSEKTLKFFYDLNKISGTVMHKGVKLHRVIQIDSNSGVTVNYYVYVSPKFDTKFTQIMSVPLETEKPYRKNKK